MVRGKRVRGNETSLIRRRFEADFENIDISRRGKMNLVSLPCIFLTFRNVPQTFEQNLRIFLLRNLIVHKSF